MEGAAGPRRRHRGGRAAGGRAPKGTPHVPSRAGRSGGGRSSDAEPLQLGACRARAGGRAAAPQGQEPQ
eukprot:1733007-Lingulodinium_polyedra.AAC.1